MPEKNLIPRRFVIATHPDIPDIASEADAITQYLAERGLSAYHGMLDDGAPCEVAGETRGDGDAEVEPLRTVVDVEGPFVRGCPESGHPDGMPVGPIHVCPVCQGLGSALRDGRRHHCRRCGGWGHLNNGGKVAT